jgi:hypothetical protein
MRCDVFSALWASKVGKFWEWSDYLRQCARDADKEPLFVNLDETAVSMCSPAAKGMVVTKRWWRGQVRPGQSIPRSVRRSMVTHVGLCTHRTDVQGRLPQIFIGNERIFTQRLMGAVSDLLPPKILFWRKKSSWNTAALMVQILNEISHALEAFPKVQIILVLDCSKIHLTPAVLKTAADLNLWLLVVPARCTWLLQPLDTHVFSPYKAFLRRAYRDSKNAEGQVSPEAWAQTLVDVSTTFLCGRTWEHAFCQTGILGDRSRLTRDLAAAVGDMPRQQGTVQSVSAGLIRNLLPRRHVFSYWQFVRRPNRRRFRLLVT